MEDFINIPTSNICVHPVRLFGKVKLGKKVQNTEWEYFPTLNIILERKKTFSNFGSAIKTVLLDS